MAKRERRDRSSFEGSSLRYNAAVQQRYRSTLQQLLDRMEKTVRREVLKLLRGEIADDYFDEQEEQAAMDASIASRARMLMNRLSDTFSQLFGEKAKPVAREMVAQSAVASSNGLRGSLKDISEEVSLKTSPIPKGMEEIVKSLVTENVNLIESIPELYLKDVTGEVMRSITFPGGADVESVVSKRLTHYKGIADRRVKNISLDQTRKAYNSLNKARMQAVGIKQFVWLHSGGGQHPRRSHQAMSGKTYSFDNLPVINQEQVDRGYESPVRGIPGQAINCKCTMKPVIRFEGED